MGLLVMSMAFTLFLHVCLPIAMVVGAGWLMDRKFQLHLESLVKLNLYLLVPAFIFVRLQDTTLAGGGEGRIMLAAFLCLISCAFVSMIVGRLLRIGEQQQKAHTLASMLGNCGNFGLPLVILAFGEAAAPVQVCVLVTMNVSTFTVGLFLANSDARGGWRSQLRALSATLRQPAIYAVTAAFICRAMDWRLQEVKWLWHPFEMMADSLIGFALLTLGVQLSQTKPAPLGLPLVSALGIRLLIAPVIALGIVSVMGFDKATASVIILTAGAPTAVNSALLAHEFGGDRRFATASVYYSTLLSLITVTATLTILKAW